MHGKIGFVVSIIAAIMNYLNGDSLYFWLSIANGLIILIFGYLASYMIAKPEIEKFKNTVWKIETNVETDEESTPTWSIILLTLTIIGSFILLSIGIKNR